MRRWNGWGDEADDTQVGTTPRRFLEQAPGPATDPATLAEVVASVPAFRRDPTEAAAAFDDLYRSVDLPLSDRLQPLYEATRRITGHPPEV